MTFPDSHQISAPAASNVRRAVADKPEFAVLFGDPNPLPKGIAALTVGAAVLIAVFADAAGIPGWAQDYGTVLVYLALTLVVSVACGLCWFGLDTLLGSARRQRSSKSG